MKHFENQEQESPMITIRNKNHKHSDIFNTKDAGYLVIKNDQPVHRENIFQKNIDDALEKYEGTKKRPASSYNKSNVTYQEGSYAFNQDWSSPNQFSAKTLVNQSVKFEQDYHHKRRFQQSSSNIFPSDPTQAPRMYKKNIQTAHQKTNHPNVTEIFGRKNILKQQINKINEETKKYSHNYSNLFGLGERIQKIKVKEENQIQNKSLIPNGLSWEQYDSVLQNGCKDQEVGEDYHRKRNLENMKSSMDTHNQYQSYNKVKKIQAPVAQMADILNKYGHILGEGDQNNQKISNQTQNNIPAIPKTQVITRKTNQRPNSAMKTQSKSQKQVQITVTKGLTSKFNLNSLCEQCRLHSIVLAQYNNTVAGQKGTGRGTIKVIPQKKYGLDVLCSWLRSQGLSILVRGA